MSTTPTTRPQPGDTVTVAGLDGTLEVLSFDGSLFTMRSEHGVTCRAGCLVVRLAEKRADIAA